MLLNFAKKVFSIAFIKIQTHFYAKRNVEFLPKNHVSREKKLGEETVSIQRMDITLRCLAYWMLVVDVGADQTGGGRPSCMKIGYSSREPIRVVRPCIKIGYVSAMY